MAEQVLMRFIECQRCFHRKPIPAGASQVDPSHACIGYREPQQAGPIPRTMAEVQKENAELREWQRSACAFMAKDCLWSGEAWRLLDDAGYDVVL